jgi:CPA1 family monovalent cation:H+ antiporter
MGLTITAMLAMFFLLAVSSGVFFLAQRFRVPYTVLLVAVGTFILVPLSNTPAFSFIHDFTLSPELLFYLFLPVLIFESAYNMQVRRVIENIKAISALSIVSLIISTFFIGYALVFAFGFIGIELPLIMGLLFGALISATDPVAVLALFKDFGAPRRLTLLFEGESIFNDGTAVALFLVILGVAVHGFSGTASVIEGVISFTIMVIGGIIMGTLMGGVFAKAIGYAKENEFVQITLTIVLAHLTFIITDFLSQHLAFGEHHIHLSAIIATAIASMVLGSYGRAKIPPSAEEFIEKFWGQFAFLANSIVFVLIGLIFASLPFNAWSFAVPVLVTIFVVAIGRALSIYPVVALLNRFAGEEHIPTTWTHLLAWGSLRGALAVTMVLLIPDDLAIAGWQYASSPKEFILALTLGCIFATLFVKATTIKWLMDRLRINELTDVERVSIAEARAFVDQKALERLKDFAQKGYVEEGIADRLIAEHDKRYHDSRTECDPSTKGASDGSIAERIIRLYAIGVEKHHLKELYGYGEVNENVYRRIMGKLSIQNERADRGLPHGMLSAYHDTKDVFEVLANLVRKLLAPSHLRQSESEQYMYYRAQSIIARKVLKVFRELETNGNHEVFGVEVFMRTKERYEMFRKKSLEKMDAIADAHPRIIAETSERLARRGMLKVEEATLHDLFQKEMITPKVYQALREEMRADAERLSERL